MAGRGRGFARGASDSPNAQVLRRPGETSIMHRFESSSPKAAKITVEEEIKVICEKIVKLDFTAKPDLNPLSDKVKEVCQSTNDIEKCVETAFTFALKSKWNAHVTAIFCNSLGDITVDEVKFRTHLLRKLQIAYKERNKKYLELESFLMDITFLCEIYHHVRIDNRICLKVLSRPIIDYFGMMIDGGSQKEVEVIIEQFPKCYLNLKENDAAGLDILLCKIRKQIICETSNVTVKAMLVQLFENILTDFEPLSDSAKTLYESLSKPVIRICE